MMHTISPYSDDFNRKPNPFNYKVGQFQTAPITSTSPKKDYVLLLKENIDPDTYRSEIITVNTSEKFNNALIIRYRLRKKIAKDHYDSKYTDVVFTYFENNQHFKNLDNTLVNYGLVGMEASSIIGLIEEVTVTYLPGERFGYFSSRKLISLPHNLQNTANTTSPTPEEDEELPFK